jgi:osmotically-inducible protein OsmY
MPEWDPDGENSEPERDYRRDYTAGRRRQDNQRGVWSIGGDPREPGERPCGSHAGKGPRNYRRSDARIYEDVCEALTRDGEVDATDLEVNVQDGQVTLSGSVAADDMNQRAEAVAACCAGVRGVQNRLETKAPPR